MDNRILLRVIEVNCLNLEIIWDSFRIVWYLIWIYLNFKFKLSLFEMIWLIIFLNFPIWFECIWHSNINCHNLKWFDWLCALIFLFDLNLFDFQILNEIIWTNLICLISVDEKFDLNQVEILVFLNLFDLIWRVARKLRK